MKYWGALRTPRESFRNLQKRARLLGLCVSFESSSGGRLLGVATSESVRGHFEGVHGGFDNALAFASSATALVIGANMLANALTSIAGAGIEVLTMRRELRTGRLLFGPNIAVCGGSLTVAILSFCITGYRMIHIHVPISIPAVEKANHAGRLA